MVSTPQKIQLLLEQHTESVIREFIEYLSTHSKLKPQAVLDEWNSFKNNNNPSKIEKTISNIGKCTHVFTRGNKTGQTCKVQTKGDNVLCTKHLKGKIKSTEFIKTEFDKDVLEIISEEESILDIQEDIIDDLEDEDD